MTINLKELHDFAYDVAIEAGNMLIEAAKRRTDVNSIRLKANSVDIVTETDFQVEQFIKKAILDRYPSHKFIGEETYSAGNSKAYLINDEPTWCVDPLDGTVNYVHLFPMVCVSIGFTLEGHPVMGVVHAPFLNNTYSAYRNGGSWLNKEIRLPLQATELPQNAPKGCIFSCEWGKDRRYSEGSNLYNKVETFLNMASEFGSRNGRGGMVHGIRSLGSTALDLCFIATGAFDINIEFGCWEWDVCAGICIVEEAGGLMTTANPPEIQDVVPPVQLGSRLYLAIRGCVDTEGETTKQAQERVVKEVWKRVNRLDYSRPTE